MTSAAVESEFAIMNIVRLMAVCASASQPRLRNQGPPVTAVAWNLEMSTLQGKVRLPVVVELPLQPVHGVVAQGTILREAIRVRVAVAMALDTLGGRVAENM